MEEIKYWVGLSGFKGLGIKRLKLLKRYFGSTKKIWEATTTDYIKVGIKLEMAKQWQKRDLDKEMELLNKQLIKIITIEDKNYPKLLKEIDSPPFLIYVKGSLDCLNEPSLTVVGSRQPTDYGRRITGKLVKELENKKLAIVSGLARGIDSLAHRTCLQNSGKTVAVLGHGFDQIYPPENRLLAEEIVQAGGALITEYTWEFPIDKINFPQRDRIMAGLTLGTLVIEGRERSGTKITAFMAADYGREVFCVPGQIGTTQAEAPAQLIQHGAKLVTKVEDILEELNLPLV